MTTIRHLLCIATFLTAASVVSAAVPGTINYQGRLTDAAGAPQPGAKTMSLKIYDAATAGTQLYAESIGTVTADANGVYAFQFGAAGTTDATTTEMVRSFCSASADVGWGAHAPSRVVFGALAEDSSPLRPYPDDRRTFPAGAPETAREGACAPHCFRSLIRTKPHRK